MIYEHAHVQPRFMVTSVIWPKLLIW